LQSFSLNEVTTIMKSDFFSITNGQWAVEVESYGVKSAFYRNTAKYGANTEYTQKQQIHSH
jgi:hypothetical protein